MTGTINQIYEVLISTPDADGQHYQKIIIGAGSLKDAIKKSDNLIAKNYDDTLCYHNIGVKLLEDVLLNN